LQPRNVESAGVREHADVAAEPVASTTYTTVSMKTSVPGFVVEMRSAEAVVAVYWKTRWRPMRKKQRPGSVPSLWSCAGT
jgi:hypothetical protein